MLKIAVIDDEVMPLTEIACRILAFEDRARLQVKPFWVKSSSDLAAKYDFQIERVLSSLREAGIDKKTEPVEILEDVRKPANFQKLIDGLKEFQPNLIFCDAGMGGGVAEREVGILVVEEMSKYYSDPKNWHCWIVSQYDIEEIKRDLELANGTFNLTNHHIEKAEIISGIRSKCPPRLVRILGKALLQVSDTETRIIGESRKIKDAIKNALDFADSKKPVLIRGESGTGKGLYADLIHYNSERRNKPYITINCGAIPEHLLESELFGHKKGSFTGAFNDKKGLFEAADGGTLFLDEIGELNISLQVKLLRAIQENKIRRIGATQEIKIDVRIIAATNRDLLTMMQEGSFREDLYYRLEVLPITLPALRERPEDIPHLVKKFVEEFNKNNEKKIIERITPEALQKIQEYHYPGNVRELQGIIEWIGETQWGGFVDVEDLPERILATVRQPAPDHNENLSDELSYQEFSEMSAEQIWQKLKLNEGRVKLDLRTIDKENPKNGSGSEVGKFWKADSKKCYEVIVSASRDYNNRLSEAECKHFFNISIKALRRKLKDKEYDTSILSMREKSL